MARAGPGGWGALLLAAAIGGWVALPLLRPGGADLAALRPGERTGDHPWAAPAAAPPPAPFPGAPPAVPRAPGLKGAPLAPLDVNRATAAELASLPGIGPGLAARIVAYRRAVGPFPSPEALRGVPGIGPKRFERIAAHIAVAAAPHLPSPLRAGEGAAQDGPGYRGADALQ